MDEGLSYTAGGRSTGDPHGVQVRHRPPGEPGLLHGAIRLPDGRLAMAVGRCSDADADRLRLQMWEALRGPGDPGTMLQRWGAAGASIQCALVDPASSTVVLGGTGTTDCALIAGPDMPHRALRSVGGRPATAALPPGATLVLCTHSAPDAGSVLDAGVARHPAQTADELIECLPGPANPGVAVLVYRQPPGPLEITMPAEPKNLATIRNRLRAWLDLVGVGPEATADCLLAVGEAASNATEHAVIAAGRKVDLSLRASVGVERLRFEVSDNGRWKPAPSPNGHHSHRGHGIRLINALVDTADVISTEQGTTVEMEKELRS